MQRVASFLAAASIALATLIAKADPPAIPPNIMAKENLPMVMLTASKDFTMFWKAYTDFEDIDFDGKIDYTFKPSFKYYGYFDPTKCYTYSGTQYEPYGKTTFDSSGSYYCEAGKGLWSGSFMNWATMSRIDVLRKVLYGGSRYVDSSTATVLEMSFVPRNSQAFVKYYNGSDLDKLTPFNDSTAMAKGITLCRRPAENLNSSETDSLHKSPRVFTPEIRVAYGNMILWNMTEVKTCNWSDEVSYTWKDPTITFLDSNYVTPSGLKGADQSNYKHVKSVPAKSSGAKYSTFGPGFIARIKACVSKALIGEETCTHYGAADPGGVWKPTGLLHRFGQSSDQGNVSARAEFALMMGSYDYNLEAGILRKNMSEMNDEINNSDGTFTNTAGIIKSLDEVTLYGYDVGTGNYSETCYSDTLTNGHCPSWGNPVGELLLESLRYYAGKSAAKTVVSGGKDETVGVSSAAWNDPLKTDTTYASGKKRSDLYGQPICRPLNMVTISGGVNSYDNIDPAKTSDMNNFSSITTKYTVTALTDLIGNSDHEKINGTKRLVGYVQDSASASDKDSLCTPKMVTTLGQIIGACPEGPNFKGSYLGAGAAFFANVMPIRTDLTADATKVPKDAPFNKLTVRNYSVSMSGGIATIQVPVPGATGKFVYITPASIDSLRAPAIPGNMVDFKILSRSNDGLSGAALVLWQHSMLGEDQDQDMLGTIRWQVSGTSSAPKLTIYTQTVEADTGSGQPYAFGYTILGTKDALKDGAHYHSSINSYTTTETGVDVSLATVTSSGSCSKLCVKVGANYYVGETSLTYDMSGVQDALIKEPLWMMAKYGGFKYTKDDYAAGKGDLFYPTRYDQWDRKGTSGTTCVDTSVPCDGNPDAYFFARRPDLLEKSLLEVFQDIVNSSNTSPAIASSQLRANDYKYVAKFDVGDGHGELAAFKVDSTTGFFSSTPDWSASALLTTTSAISRAVITNQGATGVAFAWGSLDSTHQGLLKGSGTDDFGKALLNWVRGDTTDKSLFRQRAVTSVMGAVVNSNPTVETKPNANYFPDGIHTILDGYSSFVTTYKTRPSVLWVGSDDGMLHGFNAVNGTPLMSYIPDPVFAKLPNWASPDGPKLQAMVDGSPFTADVKVGGSWATYLFSSLGRGGKGVFALDVTDPAAFSLETGAANTFKWQFTTADDANDLGYIVSEPTSSVFSGQSGQVAPMNNGKFGVLFGNGMGSTSGKAVLYILFADGPSGGSWTGRYVKITADVGTGNGLSQPVWVDTNNDGIADAIYAGDIKGNVWKFDVSSTDSTNWKVAYNGLPLFKATDSSSRALPISAALEFRFHPMGGTILTFATGKAFEAGDFPSTTRTDGIFGVWDAPVFATMSNATLATKLPMTTAQLEPRTLNPIGSSTTDRYVKGNAIDWSTKFGWYVPFNVTSESSVSNLAIAAGQVVVVSVSPPPAKGVGEPADCYPDVQARLTALDATTGMPRDDGLLGDGTTVDETDASGKTIKVHYPTASIGLDDQKVRLTSDSIGTGVKKGDGTTTSTDGSCASGKLNCVRVVGDKEDLSIKSANTNGRVYWREIPGLKTK